MYSTLIKVGIGIVDAALVAMAFLVAYRLRFGSLEEGHGVARDVWLLYVSIPVIILSLLQHGMLTGYRYRTKGRIFVKTLAALVQSGVLLSAVLFLVKAQGFSRLLFGYFMVFCFLFVMAEKLGVKILYDAALKRGVYNIDVLLAGRGRRFEKVLQRLRGHPEWGIRVRAKVDPIVDGVGAIEKRLKEEVIDEMYVLLPRDQDYHRVIDAVVRVAQPFGVPTKILLNFDELTDLYAQYPCRIAGDDGILLAPYNLNPDQLIVKRIMDLVGALVGLIITGLLAVPVAFAIKFDSPGPLFFKQRRVGKHGRRFILHKFRTMYVDAEQRKEELMAQNIHKGPFFKVPDDPRVTRVGGFLRKYSIDEFPQFWNVLKGDMSLVGTRPPTEDEVAMYDDSHFKRISIKPGITGLWQVSGRNAVTDFDQVVQLDVNYIRNWSPWLDLKIIIKTIGVLFGRRSVGM